MSAALPPRPAPRAWALTRARLALLLVLVYAGASTVQWVLRAAQWRPGAGPDEVTADDRRFGSLRAELPAGRVVGYVGDPDLTGPDGKANDVALLHFRRFLLAQYALAPAVLVEGTEPELVVGNYFDERSARPAPAGFEVAGDFGSGVFLYRRSRR